MNKSDTSKLNFPKTTTSKPSADLDHNLTSRNQIIIPSLMGDYTQQNIIILSHTKCCSEGMLLLYLKSLQGVLNSAYSGHFLEEHLFYFLALLLLYYILQTHDKHTNIAHKVKATGCAATQPPFLIRLVLSRGLAPWAGFNASSLKVFWQPAVKAHTLNLPFHVQDSFISNSVNSYS